MTKSVHTPPLYKVCRFLAFVCVLFTFIAVSCNELTTANSTTLSIKVPIEQLKNVSSARSASWSDDLDPYNVDITLYVNGLRRTQRASGKLYDFSKKNFVFENVPIHAKIKAEAKIFTKHNILAWSGKSPTVTLSANGNDLAIEMHVEDVLLANKVIENSMLQKTSELVVISSPTTINGDDSAWSGYVKDTEDAKYKGVFISGRSVILRPYVIGKYEVTQELYNAVLEKDRDCECAPSLCVEIDNVYNNMLSGERQNLRPVENLTWYDAVYFCNALTKLVMSEDDYVYTIVNVSRDSNTKSITSANVTQDLNKKGYRLPTEAEWEFAARGGDVNAPQWKYSYAGVNTERAPGSFATKGNDSALDAYAWYGCEDSLSGTAGYGTHEVGTKKPNTLGIYDMSGNVWEWCWDWYNVIEINTPMDGPRVGFTEPGTNGGNPWRMARGGSWVYNGTINNPSYCSVSHRGDKGAPVVGPWLGFRIARSL